MLEVQITVSNLIHLRKKKKEEEERKKEKKDTVKRKKDVFLQGHIKEWEYHLISAIKLMILITESYFKSNEIDTCELTLLSHA